MPLNDLTYGAGRVPDLDVTWAQIVTTQYLDEDQPRIPVPLGGGRLLVSRRYLRRIQGALSDYQDTPADVASEPGAPVWRDGPPPRTEPGKPVYVWREGCDTPVLVMYSEGTRRSSMIWLPPTNRETGRYEPWGDARWAPIPRPDHNPKS